MLKVPPTLHLRASFQGMAWMIGATLVNTVEQTLVHALGPAWPPFLQLFWRQGCGLLLLLPFILRDPVGVLRTPRPSVMMFRSAAAMIGLALSIYGFSRLPIALANALTFTRPLWLVVLAVLILRERFDAWRISATVVGFAGVLVMVGPIGAMSYDWGAFAATLGSALLFALSFVAIKSMTADNRSITIVTYGVLFGLLLSIGPAMFEWKTPTLREGLFLSAMGVTSLSTFTCVANALKLADAVTLAPIDYLRLPLAIFVGLTLFGERPALSALAGIVLIIVATGILLIRERRRHPD